MNEETENILQQITNERNITLSSKRLYWNAVEQYEQVQGLPLKELLEEAEKLGIERQRVITRIKAGWSIEEACRTLKKGKMGRPKKER